jgi:hypothetical protein
MLVNNVQSSIYSPVNLWLKWQNINKIATESIAVVLTPENHHKSHTKSLPRLQIYFTIYIGNFFLHINTYTQISHNVLLQYIM